MGTIVVGTTPTIYITDFNVIKPLEMEKCCSKRPCKTPK